MNKPRIATRKLTELALLTAAALVLGYVEYLIPISGVPGVKLGLSNMVLLYAVALLDKRNACLLMILKVGLSGLLFGGFSAMIYSFAGGVLSLAVMLLLYSIKGMSLIGVSVGGALAHNIGQILVAACVVGFRSILFYVPILMIAAVIAGILTGVTAKLLVAILSKRKDGQETIKETKRDDKAEKDEK